MTTTSGEVIDGIRETKFFKGSHITVVEQKKLDDRGRTNTKKILIGLILRKN